MKILCVIDSLGSGGAQRQIVELAKGFKEKGNDVSFLIYHNICFFKSELDSYNIKVNIIDEKNYLKRIFKMRKFIRNSASDGVVSFLDASNFIAEFSSFPKRNWRLLVCERSADPRILKSLKRVFFRWMHIFSDVIITNSHANKKMINRIVPYLLNNKINVIYNILDFKKWKPDNQNLFKKSNKLEIIVAATQTYYKNAIGLVEAVNKLNFEERKKLKINWYGKIIDNSSKEVRKKILYYNLNNTIKFYNQTENIYEKYLESDAVALFSFFEGLPNTVCEGMMLQKPVIASDVSDVSLLLKNKNVIFNPQKVSEITKSISWLLSQNTEKLNSIGKINRKNALKLFNKDKNVNSFLRLLQKQ